MLMRQAMIMVDMVVSESLGNTSMISVAEDGFKVIPFKVADAESLGSGGRVLQIKADGWGPAFEARTVSEQIVVDLNQDRDGLARSILTQTELLVHTQLRQRARAAVLGIAGPLSVDQFSDPTRLSTDIASARFLHDRFGSDEAVLAWLRTGLRAIAVSRMSSATGTPIRVHGLNLVLPVLLRPSTISERPYPLPGRPRWQDDTVAVLASDLDLLCDLSEGGTRTLAATPLDGRTTKQSGSWPPDSLNELAMSLARRMPANRNAPPPEPLPKEMRFTLERRMVGVGEAFG